MTAPALDREERAARYLDAMAALQDLLTGRVPGLPLEAVQLGQLIGLLNEEAIKFAPPAVTARYAANDSGGAH
jgi:hypothetical protein